MCELSTKQQKALSSISNAKPADNGKTIKWDATLGRFVFSTFEEVGNYVTIDTNQIIDGAKQFNNSIDFFTDVTFGSGALVTVGGIQVATVDDVSAAIAAINFSNYVDTISGQIIDGRKNFQQRPTTYNSGIDTFESLVAESDLMGYATIGTTSSLNSAIIALSATVATKADFSALSAYALKSGNLSQFASTSSAQLAALISDETGSGALVFASSPALSSPSLSGTIRHMGATSGYVIFAVPAVSGSATLTFPAVTDTVAVLGTAQTWSATQTFTTIAATTITATTSLITDVLVCNAAAGGLELRFKSGFNGNGISITNALNGNSVGNPSGSTFNLLDMTSTTFVPAAGSKKFRGVNLSYTLTPSGTQTSNDFTAIFVNATEGGSLQGMTHNLMDLQLGGVTSIKATTTGGISFGSNPFNYITCALGSNGSTSINGNALRVAHNLGSTAGFGIHLLGVNGTMSWTSGSGGSLWIRDSFGAAAGTGSFSPLFISYTINNSGAQTGSSTATGIYMLGVETSLNGMVHNLMDLQSTISGTTTSKFKVDSVGSLTMTGKLTALGSSASQILKINLGNNSQVGLTSTSAGVLILDDNAGGFNRVQFGGTSSAFPSLKRNSAAIDFRLADDSGYASLNCQVINASTSVATSMYFTSLKDVGGINLVATIGTTSITMASTSILITAASTNTQAGFRLLAGSAPAAPINGDVWLQTDDSLCIRINGVTRRFTLT